MHYEKRIFAELYEMKCRILADLECAKERILADMGEMDKDSLKKLKFILSEYERVEERTETALQRMLKEIATIERNITDGLIKGDQGEKGDPFTYDDFTPEQLAALKGEKGERGERGPKGADGTMTFTDLTDEQKATLKGDKGDKGDRGEPFTYENFTAEQLAALKGEKGDTGETGPQGPAGQNGRDGVDATPYTHPTSAGYKHIPSGGSEGSILAYSANGTAKWVSPNCSLLTTRTSTGTYTIPAKYRYIAIIFSSGDSGEKFEYVDMGVPRSGVSVYSSAAYGSASASVTVSNSTVTFTVNSGGASFKLYGIE